MTTFYPCFRLRHYEVQRKCVWELTFNEIHQFLALIYRQNKNVMRNITTSFDASKEVYEPRVIRGIICQELSTGLCLLARKFS